MLWDEIRLSTKLKYVTASSILFGITAGVMVPETYGEASIVFDSSSYVMNEEAFLTVNDPNANFQDDVVETVDALVVSTSDTQGIIITLMESGANTGVFVGSLGFTKGFSGDGVLKAKPGDTIQASYNKPLCEIDCIVSARAQIISQAPIADAGVDQKVNEGTLVTLSGIGEDQDGDELLFSWKQITGPEVVLSNPNSPDPSFTAPDIETLTVLTFQLKVSDGILDSFDTVDITVVPLIVPGRKEIIDTIGPVLNVPSNIVIEASGPSGAFVRYKVTAVDNVDLSITPVCNPPSGTTFPLGTTIIMCTAKDKAGNSAEASFTVTVQDTTPPVITEPPDITLEVSDSTLLSLGTPMVSDLVDPSPRVTHNAPAEFPVGTTVVTWTATDLYGNSATATQLVAIIEPSVLAPEFPSWILPAIGGVSAGAAGTYAFSRFFRRRIDRHPSVEVIIRGGIEEE